jgi:hypothetical protein
MEEALYLLEENLYVRSTSVLHIVSVGDLNYLLKRIFPSSHVFKCEDHQLSEKYLLS